VPLHPLAILAFLGIDTAINTAGHCGYEVTPKWLLRWSFFRIFSTVTSHDAHHTNMRVNFGSFFNVWDRFCGTYDSGFHNQEAEVQPAPAGRRHAARRHSTADAR
jgi:sterol desaturase/sphingolipid hydroxylase (fatty acid hydroxylase superfamily)